MALPEEKVRQATSIIGGEEEPGNREVLRRIIRLAAPTVAEQTLMMLVGMFDMIQVGGIGPAAITAVGLSNQATRLTMALFSAISVGATALVARLIGSGDTDNASEAAKQSLVLAVLGSSLLAVLICAAAYPIMAFMHAGPDVIYQAVVYLRIVGVSMLFQLSTVILTGVLRGAGDTRTPMVVNTVANLVNILFNWLLINGIWVFPKLLVAGAAYATLLSRVVGFLLVLRVFLSGKFVLQISFRNGYHPDFNLVRRILNVGLPAAGEQFIMWGGMLLYARVVSGLGTDVYAAHQVANNIESLAYIPVFGFSMAATPLVGQSLGAQKPKRAARYGMGTCYAAMAVATVAGLALLLAPRLMAKLYTDSLPVIDMSVMALRLIGWFEPIQAAMFVIMACLRGAGDTRYPLYVSLAGVWLVRVVFSNIFVSLGWGLQGAWYAMAMDITVRSVLAFWRYRTGKWQTARV